MKALFEKLIVRIMTGYIRFVYATSKINLLGRHDIFCEDNLGDAEHLSGTEKVIALFWHGDSYCLYPALKGRKLSVLTTRDRRGDYITDVCNYFGYKTIRLPDNSEGGNYLFKIRRAVSVEDVVNVAVALDGPLGPYHVPKDFSFVLSLLAKRKVLPITCSVKRKIELGRRWDRFKIPLPFNVISICFHDAIEVTKQDKNEEFASLKEHVRLVMESDRSAKRQK